MATMEDLYRARRGTKRLRPGFELEGESIPTTSGDVYSALGRGGGGESSALPESDADLLEPLPPVAGPMQGPEYRPEELHPVQGPEYRPEAMAPSDAESARLTQLATASSPDESWGAWLRSKVGRGGGLAAAQQVDRESALANMLQRAGRQMVAGLTRTPEAETIGGPVDAEKTYRSQEQLKRENMLKAMKDAREGRVADAEVEAKLAAAGKDNRWQPAAPPPAKPDESWREDVARQRSSAYAEWLRAKAARVPNGPSAAQEARAAKALEDVPPGFEVATDAHPSGETRKKFTALLSSSEKMKGLTQQMRAALKDTNGLERVLDPQTATALKQLATMISIEGKNVAGLGALSGPDMGLMNAIAADPTSVRANLTVDLPKMLDQLDAWGDNSVEAETRATGIRRKATPAAAAATGKVKVINPDTGNEVEVSPALAEKLRKRGAR